MATAKVAHDSSITSIASKVRELIVVELAAVMAMDRTELERDIDGAGGDVEIDSPQAEVIMARLERHFDCKLPRVSDLAPEQFNSITTLVGLIERRLAVGVPMNTVYSGHQRRADVRVA